MIISTEKMDQLALLEMGKQHNLRARQINWNQSTLLSKQSPEAGLIYNRQKRIQFILPHSHQVATKICCFFSPKASIIIFLCLVMAKTQKLFTKFRSHHQQFPINISSNLIYSLAKTISGFVTKLREITVQIGVCGKVTICF